MVLTKLKRIKIVPRQENSQHKQGKLHCRVSDALWHCCWLRNSSHSSFSISYTGAAAGDYLASFIHTPFIYFAKTLICTWQAPVCWALTCVLVVMPAEPLV